MQTKYILISALAIIVIFFIGINLLPKPTPPSIDGGSRPTDVQESLPDLQISDVRVEKLEGQPDPRIKYKLVATIRNEGDGVADGFRAGCTYDCPSSDPSKDSRGLAGYLVQSGNLQGHSEAVYEVPFLIDCSFAGASDLYYRTMYFRCGLDNRIEETNKDNNEWEGTLNTP